MDTRRLTSGLPSTQENARGSQWKQGIVLFAAAVLFAAGALYTWGTGAFGVLGHGDTEDCRTPREVSLRPPAVKEPTVGAYGMLLRYRKK